MEEIRKILDDAEVVWNASIEIRKTRPSITPEELLPELSMVNQDLRRAFPLVLTEMAYGHYNRGYFGHYLETNGKRFASATTEEELCGLHAEYSVGMRNFKRKGSHKGKKEREFKQNIVQSLMAERQKIRDIAREYQEELERAQKEENKLLRERLYKAITTSATINDGH